MSLLPMKVQETRLPNQAIFTLSYSAVETIGCWIHAFHAVLWPSSFAYKMRTNCVRAKGGNVRHFFRRQWWRRAFSMLVTQNRPTAYIPCFNDLNLLKGSLDFMPEDTNGNTCLWHSYKKKEKSLSDFWARIQCLRVLFYCKDRFT